MKVVKRRRLGTDAWRELLSKFDGSGVSVKMFCAREGISEWTFKRWHKRLNEGLRQRPMAKRATVAAGGFVDLGTLRPSTSAAADRGRVELRLDLGDGLIVHLVRG
jgi:putative transposase